MYSFLPIFILFALGKCNCSDLYACAFDVVCFTAVPLYSEQNSELDEAYSGENA